MTDIETLLRKLSAATPDEPLKLAHWVNGEGRVQIRVEEREFVVFGDNVKAIELLKPPAQVAGVHGIDAYGGMGGRQ